MYPEIVTVVRDGLREALGTDPVKSFYDGDPDVIPEFNLPAIVVSKKNDVSSIDTNAQDDVTEAIVVKVIFDKRDDWTATTDEVDLTERKIRRLVEARDQVTGKYLPNTVKRVIREVLEQNNLLIVGDTTFELDGLLRPNEIVTMEGVLTIPIQYSVLVK